MAPPFSQNLVHACHVEMPETESDVTFKNNTKVILFQIFL